MKMREEKMKKQILFMILLVSLQSFCSEDKASPQNKTSVHSTFSDFTFSGRIVFQSNSDGDNEIYLLSSKGTQKLTDNTWEDEYPVWSPDAKKIAFTANPKGNYDIFIMNPDGSEVEAVTSSQNDEKEPAWFPEGKRLIFSQESSRFMRTNVALYIADIANQSFKRAIPSYKQKHGIGYISPVAPLITFTGKKTVGWDVAVYNWMENKITFLDEGGKSCRARFSKDGTKLAFVSSKADGKGDIWMMNPDGSEKTRLTFRDETFDYFPSWSPDGRYIAFNSSKKHGHNDDWELLVLEVSTKKIFFLYNSPGNDVFPCWH